MLLNVRSSYHRSTAIGRSFKTFPANRLGDSANVVVTSPETKEQPTTPTPLKDLPVQEDTELKSEKSKTKNKNKTKKKDTAESCNKAGSDSTVVNDEEKEETSKGSNGLVLHAEGLAEREKSAEKRAKREKKIDVPDKGGWTVDQIVDFIDTGRKPRRGPTYGENWDLLETEMRTNSRSIKRIVVGKSSKKDVIENDSGFDDCSGERELSIPSSRTSECSEKEIHDRASYALPGSETPESLEFDLGDDDVALKLGSEEKKIASTRERNMTDSSGVGTASEADGSSPTIFMEIAVSERQNGVDFHKCDDFLNWETSRDILEYEDFMEDDFQKCEGEFVVVQKKKKLKSRISSEADATNCEDVFEFSNPQKEARSFQNERRPTSIAATENSVKDKCLNGTIPEILTTLSEKSFVQDCGLQTNEKNNVSESKFVCENSSVDVRTCRNHSASEIVGDVVEENCDDSSWIVVTGMRRLKEASMDDSVDAQSRILETSCCAQPKATPFVKNYNNHPRNGYTRSKSLQYSNGNNKSRNQDSAANPIPKKHFPMSTRKNCSRNGICESQNSVDESKIMKSPQNISFGPACRDMDTFPRAVDSISDRVPVGKEGKAGCCSLDVAKSYDKSSSTSKDLERRGSFNGFVLSQSADEMEEEVTTRGGVWFDLLKTQKFLHNAYLETISLRSTNSSSVVMYNYSGL